MEIEYIYPDTFISEHADLVKLFLNSMQNVWHLTTTDSNDKNVVQV